MMTMAFGETLSWQAPLLDELLGLLRREQTLLLQGEVDGPALETIAGDKRDCLQRLQSLEDQRLAALKNMGLDSSPGAQYQAATSTDCLRLWEDVQAVTRQTKHLNQLNGILIQKRLQHNQNVLNTLRELASAPVYDADGQARRGSSLRTSA